MNYMTENTDQVVHTVFINLVSFNVNEIGGLKNECIKYDTNAYVKLNIA